MKSRRAAASCMPAERRLGTPARATCSSPFPLIPGSPKGGRVASCGCCRHARVCCEGSVDARWPYFSLAFSIWTQGCADWVARAKSGFLRRKYWESIPKMTLLTVFLNGCCSNDTSGKPIKSAFSRVLLQIDTCKLAPICYTEYDPDNGNQIPLPGCSQQIRRGFVGFRQTQGGPGRAGRLWRRRVVLTASGVAAMVMRVVMDLSFRPGVTACVPDCKDLPLIR
jgi:hypothetical protein